MTAVVSREEKRMKTEIHLTRTYPHPRAKVWRALTDPLVMEKWLMRPENFEPKVGARFRLVAKPQPGWRGFVDCEVLAVDPERQITFSWMGDEKGKPMMVTFSLEDDGSGTRFTLDHVGFEGLSGWLLARLMMGPGWKKKMMAKLAEVLEGM
jgi:uncharacterized protein YndB with AHSA1/START domain